METKTRILLADADTDFGKLLGERLAAEGDMELVGIASDGLEALAMVKERAPDVLLLDLVLPRIDGLELLRRLPETGRRCGVIVLSGFINSAVVSECATRGVSYFVPKPCDLAALLDRVARSRACPRAGSPWRGSTVGRRPRRSGWMRSWSRR